MNWTQLPDQDAHAFLKAVAAPEEAVIFHDELCEVHRLPLPFYDGYNLVRIVNRNMIPHMLLDYLSNGEHHYYLDGSDAVFHVLNAKGALTLTEDNVISYLDLYISYVYERGNSLEFISDPYDIPHKGTAAMGMHFGAIAHHPASSARFDRTRELYDVRVPLIYQGETVKAEVEIEKSGVIHIQKPLKTSFLNNLDPQKPIFYRHPLEDAILEQCKTLLSGTETGKKLLKIAQDHAVPLRIFCSPNYHGFITNQPVAYILMPAEEKSATYVQVLCLGGALRDVEQILAGYGHPHPLGDENLYTTINYGKNLDMAVQMCKIVKELEDQNIPEALAELQRMGLGDVYSAWKTGMDDDALLNVYLSGLEKYGMIK